MTFDNLLGYILSISMFMRSFITIVHSVWPFSLFQNFELCTALTDVKCHFAISWASYGNPSVSIMSIVMGMQNFIKIYQKVEGIGPGSLFSEFEPRQNLDLSQILFDNLIGYILSISMCMQNFIAIFFTVLEIGPFSPFFRIWSLAKPRPKKNVSSQSLGLVLVISMFTHRFIKIFHLVQEIGPSSLFQNLALGKASTDD